MEWMSTSLSHNRPLTTMVPWYQKIFIHSTCLWSDPNQNSVFFRHFVVALGVFFLWSLTTPSISASYNRAYSDVMSAMYISINLIIPLIMEICQSTCLKPARAGGSQTNCRQIQRFILCPAPVRSLSWGQSKPYVNEVAFGYVKGLTHIHLAFRSAFKIASNNR